MAAALWNRRRRFSPFVLAVLAGCGPSDAERAVAAAMPDAGSARFQNVRDLDGAVCGEVNGRDADGAYGRYRRFVFLEEGGNAKVEAPAPADALPDSTACGKREAYLSTDERLACADAPALAAELERQREFGRLWRSRCRE